MLNWDRLQLELPRRSQLYLTAQPFPWVVLPNLFADPLPIADSFDVLWQDGQDRLIKREHLHSNKFTIDDPAEMPGVMREALATLNSPSWLGYLSNLTGLAPLFPDWSYYGGGAHISRRGGFLDVHADFQDHPRTGRRRVLNLLVYFNPGWQDAWRGHLELYDRNMKRAVVSIRPEIGTAVLFATSPTSFHGHPDRLRCPEHVMRKSLALYYYTAPASKPGLVTTDYRPRSRDYLKRFRKMIARRLRAAGLR